MKTALWIFGGFIALWVVVGIGYFIWIFAQMIFVVQIAEWKIARSDEYKMLEEGVQIEEVTPKEAKPYVFDYQKELSPDSAVRMLLTPEGEIKEGYRQGDEDPNKEVWYLKNDQYEVLFDRNEVYAVKDGKLGERLFIISPDEWTYVVTARVLDSARVLVIYYEKGQDKVVP